MSSADLPDIGEMIPKVEGTFVEWNGDEYFRCKVSSIPEHELIRIGFRLYWVHEYVASIDAWRVTRFNAYPTDDGFAELIARGD